MPSQGLRRFRNAAYDPFETKVDLRVRCSVCGFGGIDPERTNEPERAPGTLVTTGTTYEPTSAGDFSVVDKTVYTDVPAHSACPFCGSPRWKDGAAPNLKW